MSYMHESIMVGHKIATSYDRGYGKVCRVTVNDKSKYSFAFEQLRPLCEISEGVFNAIFDLWPKYYL